jgi:hypothetical protein
MEQECNCHLFSFVLVIDFNALFVLRDLYLHLRSYFQKLNIGIA